jgi:hypothetical protein
MYKLFSWTIYYYDGRIILDFGLLIKNLYYFVLILSKERYLQYYTVKCVSKYIIKNYNANVN